MIYISSKGGENTVLFKDFICEQWWRQNKKSNMIIVHNNTTSIRNIIIPNVYKVDVTSIKIYKLLQRMKNKWFYSHKTNLLFILILLFILSIPSIGFATLPIRLLDPVVFVVLIFLFFILSPFLLQSPVAFPFGKHSEIHNSFYSKTQSSNYRRTQASLSIVKLGYEFIEYFNNQLTSLTVQEILKPCLW